MLTTVYAESFEKSSIKVTGVRMLSQKEDEALPEHLRKLSTGINYWKSDYRPEYSTELALRPAVTIQGNDRPDGICVPGDHIEFGAIEFEILSEDTALALTDTGIRYSEDGESASAGFKKWFENAEPDVRYVSRRPVEADIREVIFPPMSQLDLPDRPCIHSEYYSGSYFIAYKRAHAYVKDLWMISENVYDDDRSFEYYQPVNLALTLDLVSECSLRSGDVFEFSGIRFIMTGKRYAFAIGHAGYILVSNRSQRDPDPEMESFGGEFLYELKKTAARLTEAAAGASMDYTGFLKRTWNTEPERNGSYFHVGSSGLSPKKGNMQEKTHKLVELLRTENEIVRIPERAISPFRQECQVTMIGDGAMAGLTGVTDILLPEGIDEIGCFAFAGCTSLRRIYIPSSVKKIGYSAFEGCSHLEHVYYEGSLDDWDKIGKSYYDDETSFSKTGGPVAEILAVSTVDVSGKEALSGARIHFGCNENKRKECAEKRK